jgi:hypothetical protein
MNIVVNVAIFSELVSLEVIDEFVKVSDRNSSTSKNVDQFCHSNVSIFIDLLQLQKILLGLPLLHQATLQLFYYYIV